MLRIVKNMDLLLLLVMQQKMQNLTTYLLVKAIATLEAFVGLLVNKETGDGECLRSYSAWPIRF
jgi:hypothetical protein